MAAHTLTLCQWVLLAGCASASIYAIVAAVAMPFFSARRALAAGKQALPWSAMRDFAGVGVSVLKPLCGVEPRLYENLRTFCNQRHGHFQLVLGVSSPDDPAIAVVRRLQAAFPRHDIELAIDTRVHGSNPKVSNLINMAERARHDVIVIADSDIAVERDYLDTVAAPHDLNPYLRTLRLNGALFQLGLPPTDMPPVSPGTLIRRRLSYAGSLIGGIAETQEMLDFCAEHGVVSDVEVVTARQLNEAYDRMVAGDVKYRFVLDTKTLQPASEKADV